jgi:hypothetical protein
VFVAAAVAASLALTGCSFNAPASLIPYSPSDGTQLDLADLRARNFLLIRGADTPALLIGSVVSTSSEPLSFSLQLFNSAGDRIVEQFEVAAMGKTDIGFNGNDGIIVEIDALPGGLYPIFISDGGDPIELLVPVLDGTLAEYREFYEQLKN